MRRFAARSLMFAALTAFTALIAACGATPTPAPDGPILLGFDSLPKALATIAPTETPTPTSTPDASRALLGLPATPSPTPTPIRGVFMGNLTVPPGTIAYRPGTRTAPAPTVPSQVVVQPGFPPAVPPAVPPVAPVSPIGTAFPPVTSGACSIAAGPPFAAAAQDATIRARIGCPTGEMVSVGLVVQPFETGIMFWRDTREIYALANVGTLWRLPDNWNEGLPANDPALQPPPDRLQPVRGFGLVWRSNPAIRGALGWALAPEQPYLGQWQPYERGAMLTGPDGGVWALAPNDNAPTSIGSHFGRR